MIPIFKIVVKLIYLDPCLVLKSLLITINYIKLVLVILEQSASMIYQISHIALKIKHYSSNLFDNSIDWKQFMSHIFECWSALIADTNFGSLVQISDFVHVVIGTRIIKTSCPRHSCAVGLSRNKSSCI